MGVALYSIPYIQDFGPHSVDDPAMILFILSLLTGLSALITLMRFRKIAIEPLSKQERKGLNP
jgi:hypothetical protein